MNLKAFIRTLGSSLSKWLLPWIDIPIPTNQNRALRWNEWANQFQGEKPFILVIVNFEERIWNKCLYAKTFLFFMCQLQLVWSDRIGSLCLRSLVHFLVIPAIQRGTRFLEHTVLNTWCCFELNIHVVQLTLIDNFMRVC